MSRLPTILRTLILIDEEMPCFLLSESYDEEDTESKAMDWHETLVEYSVVPEMEDIYELLLKSVSTNIYDLPALVPVSTTEFQLAEETVPFCTVTS